MSSNITPGSQIRYCPISEDPSAFYHLIYFITGNPGLIGYYKTFLKTLNGLLCTPIRDSSSPTKYHIYGQSLAGFEDADAEDIPKFPYSLEEQIRRSQTSLENLRIPSGPRKGQHYDNIILIGHSVGGYMLLEIIQRLRKTSSILKVTAGVLLFPTITHIAQSPSGVKISALFTIPDFPRTASSAAKYLLNLASEEFLRWLVRMVTRMPPEAVEVTTRFLKSKMGIWQALHMARDEMETITDDRWDKDIWGIEHSSSDEKIEIPKFIFYFGENDHWVANHARDALIAARGQTYWDNMSSKPTMFIDENGIDHGFCIRHSEIIAEKVYVWIIDLLESQSRE